MQTRSTTTFLVIALVGGMTVLSSCYNPGDIGERPFKCGIASPDPNGVTCAVDSDCPADVQGNAETCVSQKCVEPRDQCPATYSCDLDNTHTGKAGTAATYQFCIQPCMTDADCPSLRYVCDPPTHTFCVIPCTTDADCPTWEICDPTLNYCQTQACSASNSCPNMRTCDPVEKSCLHTGM